MHILIKSLVKMSVWGGDLGVLYPRRCTDGSEIRHEGGDLWSPSSCQVLPPSLQSVTPVGQKNLKVGLE